MANYLFVYTGGKMATTPAAQKKSMDEWMGWFQKLGKAVVDAGNPTKPGKKVAASGVRDIGGEPITGYSIVKADGLDAAVAMAKSSPQISSGGKIEVLEILPMM